MIESDDKDGIAFGRLVFLHTFEWDTAAYRAIFQFIE
jgi:hypothetical protein